MIINQNPDRHICLFQKSLGTKVSVFNKDLKDSIKADSPFNYLTTHTEEKNGLRYASVDSIICLKVLAYLNLREDKQNGKHVNDDDYKKLPPSRTIGFPAAKSSIGYTGIHTLTFRG